MHEERVGQVKWTFWPIATVVFAIVVFAMVVWSDVKQARAGKWPSCDGKLVERGVRKVQRGEETRTEIALRYTYNVSGTDYRGGRIAIGDMSYSDAKDAKRDLDDLYPAGKPVKVYYNPEEPSEAVLEPQPMSWIKTILAGIFCVVMVIAGIGWRVMLTRSLLERI